MRETEKESEGFSLACVLVTRTTAVKQADSPAMKKRSSVEEMGSFITSSIE